MAPFVVGSQTGNAHSNTSRLEQRLGQATSVIIPLLELGAMGYATWVLCYLIFTQYLINPSQDLRQNFHVEPRRGTGIALIVIYALLLFLLLFPFMRLVQLIWSKPDILPIGDPTREKQDTCTQGMGQYDAFICNYEGYPLFCDKCHIFKPDRAHHCKELGRCVRKMDHYCPWAGGIIAESTHKFFMQFVFYAALYTAFVWIVTAIFLADRISKTGSCPGTWIGALAVGVLFCIFTVTMSAMTGYNLAINYTSVEAIQRGGVSNIAFLITRQPQESTSLPTPPPSNDAKDSDFDDWPVLRIIQRGAQSFVVMQTKPFQHPWSGSLMQCWRETMGDSVWEWLLPIKMSPCKEKGRGGEFKWGHVVYDMAAKYEREHPGVGLALLEGTSR